MTVMVGVSPVSPLSPFGPGSLVSLFSPVSPFSPVSHFSPLRSLNPHIRTAGPVAVTVAALSGFIIHIVHKNPPRIKR